MQKNRRKKKEYRKRKIRAMTNNERVKQYGQFTWFCYQTPEPTFVELNNGQIARLFYLATYTPYGGGKD